MLIVCYDFEDDKKRTRFARFLKKFGYRIQYSVYFVKNSRRVLDNILTEIEERYEPEFDDSDHILIFKVCERCEKDIIKYGRATQGDEDVVYFG